MMFFLGMLVGTTAGFLCAAMAQAASSDAAVRDHAAPDFAPWARAATAVQRAQITSGEAANSGYEVQKRTGS